MGRATGISLVNVLAFIFLLVMLEVAGLYLLPSHPFVWILPLSLAVVVGLAFLMKRQPSTPEGGQERVVFFNSLADHWSRNNRSEALRELLMQDLADFGIQPDEHVIDIGCGTGVLIGCLLEKLDSRGNVVAVDISPNMLAHAAAEYTDERVRFVLADAEHLPMESGSADRILLFSVWPHILDKESAIAEFWRLLKPGGHLHILHHNSRGSINRVHREAHPSVQEDKLEPAHLLAASLASSGFEVEEFVEEGEYYLVSVKKRVRNE